MTGKDFCPLTSNKEVLEEKCGNCKEGNKYNCFSQAKQNVCWGTRFGMLSGLEDPELNMYLAGCD